MAYLVFVDTNIFLDFYRARGQENDLSILDRIDMNHKRIISTYQVEMEYKKNRQKVIHEALKEMKPANEISVPAYLKISKPSKAIATSQKNLKKQITKAKDRIRKTLTNPLGNDPVYKCAQRLFKANESCHLTRSKEVRHEIRELAKKRFILGYPPRKKNDTSIGDAINWEWIVRCAESCSEDIIIVSRDGDFGESLGGNDDAFINDWLKQEFKQRVSSSRKIQLTTKLTAAFKMAGIRVSAKEETQEDTLIDIIESDKKEKRNSNQILEGDYSRYIDMFDIDDDV